MNIFIKYMVSMRCKMVVEAELELAGIQFNHIDLGCVTLPVGLTDQQHQQLKRSLLQYGLELMDNKEAILVERIKNVIIEMVHYADELPKENYSDFISHKLKYDYTYLSNIFSRVKGTTIQQYIIKHRIEKVKELLLYDELNLTEISYQMQYSSVAHLSNQFKKVTGLTPSYFKMLKTQRMANLESF